MRTIRFGIHLSSVTPFIQAEEELQHTLQKLASIGYSTVQLYGVPYSIPDGAVASALQEAGLTCAAMQEDYPFPQPPERVVERAAACGCQYLTTALFPLQIGDVYHLEHVARDLEGVYNLAKAKGITFSFHPRRWDFRPLEGTPIYERMLALLPQDAQLTYSVYSSLGAGSTPEEILEAYAGRVDLVHFKDRRKMSGNRDMLVPLGEGEVEWGPIAAACQKAAAHIHVDVHGKAGRYGLQRPLCFCTGDRRVCPRPAPDALRLGSYPGKLHFIARHGRGRVPAIVPVLPVGPGVSDDQRSPGQETGGKAALAEAFL